MVLLSKLTPKFSRQLRLRSQVAAFETLLDYDQIKPYSEVPGPKAIPILGNTWRLLPIIGQYQVSDLGSLTRIFYKEYGKIVKLSGLVGRPDLLFVYDADEIEKVYRNEGPTPFRPSMPCLVKYKSEVRKDFFGDLPGVVGVHGEPWREFRTRVQKPILQLQTVRKYIEPIEEVTEYFIQRMMEMRDDKEEMPHDFDNEIHKWSLECIGRVSLDVRLGCLDPDLPEDSEPLKIINAAKFALRNIAVLELKFPFWRYFPTPIWTKYVNNMNYFIEICMKYINAAMERLKTKTVTDNKDLSLIERILINEPNPKTAAILALDLILVGIDTISMAVCSIMYQLATRPEEQAKLYEELKRVLPDPNVPLTTKLLDEMVYLKAFVKEVFRVYSTVIGNGRTLQQDTIIQGFHIPKGVQVVFPTLITGSMEEYVTDASNFKPERWMKNQNCPGRIHPYASLPYGHGARMCLGRRFADLEIQILLAKLIRSYKLEYNYDPLDYKVTFMYAPDGDLKFKVTKREELMIHYLKKGPRGSKQYKKICFAEKRLNISDSTFELINEFYQISNNLIDNFVDDATIQNYRVLINISMAVCSIMYQLATRPEEQAKLYEELKRVLPDPNVPLTTKLLDEMVYLKAFVKEVFRVYSTVIGNGRTLQQDTIIQGFHIPKGVQVVFPTLITGSMEEYVTDASNFKPERWMKNQNCPGRIHPYASLPYGHGARMCLGRRFADLEIQILLAKLIRSYKLEYNYDPLDYKVTFMYAPDGDLKFKVTKREE